MPGLGVQAMSSVPALVTALVEQAEAYSGGAAYPGPPQRHACPLHPPQEGGEAGYPPSAGQPDTASAVTERVSENCAADAGVYVTLGNTPHLENTRTDEGDASASKDGKVELNAKEEGPGGFEHRSGHLEDPHTGGRGRVGEEAGSNTGGERASGDNANGKGEGCWEESAGKDRLHYPPSRTEQNCRPCVVNVGDVRAKAAAGITSGAVQTLTSPVASAELDCCTMRSNSRAPPLQPPPPPGGREVWGEEHYTSDAWAFVFCPL